MPILEFLSATPKVALGQPLPALTVLRVSVRPWQLKSMERLIQLRSATQANQCGIATLREVDIEIQTEQANDCIEKDKHTALFEAFRNEGVTIRISYSDLYC